MQTVSIPIPARIGITYQIQKCASLKLIICMQVSAGTQLSVDEFARKSNSAHSTACSHFSRLARQALMSLLQHKLT